MLTAVDRTDRHGRRREHLVPVMTTPTIALCGVKLDRATTSPPIGSPKCSACARLEARLWRR